MARLAPVEELFGGRHFDAEIVVLCVRWYLTHISVLSGACESLGCSSAAISMRV